MTKKYRQDNNDKKRKQDKQYYQDNKAKLNEKFDCDCGGKYTFGAKSKHEKSLKHQQYITLYANIKII